MDSNVAGGQRRTLLGVHPSVPWSPFPTFLLFLIFPGPGTVYQHGDLGLFWLDEGKALVPTHFTPKHELGNTLDIVLMRLL